MNHDEAQARMQEIQRIMERATLFTLLPGTPAVVGGLMVLSSAARLMPIAWALFGFVRCRGACIAVLKPSPSAPSRLSTGTRQPSNATSAVIQARKTILCMGRPTRRPGASAETRKALIPPRSERAIRGGEHRIESRDACVADEDFSTVQDVVAPSTRRGTEGGGSLPASGS